MVVQCRLTLPASREVKVTLRGKLQLSALLTVSPGKSHKMSKELRGTLRCSLWCRVRNEFLNSKKRWNPHGDLGRFLEDLYGSHCPLVDLLFLFGLNEPVDLDQTVFCFFWQVSFRSLQLLTTASIQLEPSSPMFLLEERPVRQVRVHCPPTYRPTEVTVINKD